MFYINFRNRAVQLGFLTGLMILFGGLLLEYTYGISAIFILAGFWILLYVFPRMVESG